jgi:hypothetical protein
MKIAQTVTIGFSLHRPEMVPLITEHMQTHEALFLEEPPTIDFGRMLSGLMAVDDYVMTIDTEYPQFARMMCAALRELQSKGKKIFQVEPYLENLLSLHEFFADGFSPEDIAKKTLMYPVYLAEKKATGALIAYYQTASGGSFESTVDAVKRFARMDAARFRLRDTLRSQALSSELEKFTSSFIEAGVMHYSLKRLLQRQASRPTPVRSVSLAGDVLKRLGRKGHLYGPGDLLTLLYIFHPEMKESDQEFLLAARALIYSKIVIKEELSADVMPYPHLQDELLCIEATRSLSPNACRQLFARIRGVKTLDARRIVGEFVMDSHPRSGHKLKKWTPSYFNPN